MNTAAIAKFNMIEQQIRPWEVLDTHVLNVLNEINREDFVEDRYKGLAYADCQIPIAHGISMLPPTIEGRMLQSLLIEKTDRILQVGAGSGYMTACLARLGKQVLSIDNNAEILSIAQSNILSYALDNVAFEQASTDTCEYDAAFDVIAVTGSMRQPAENLKRALSIGGRLFIISGQSPAMQALLITRTDENEWRTQSLFETDLPALSQ